MKDGFTLIEVLVVMALMTVIGTILTVTFTRSLQGGNKSQVVSTIKQNGQAVLDAIDKSVRNSDQVLALCDKDQDGITDTIMIVKDKKYSRFTFVPAASNNGQIVYEDLNPSTDDLNSGALVGTCRSLALSSNSKILTDTNSQTGVSVWIDKDEQGNNIPFITQNPQSGFKNIITIDFALKPGIASPQAVTGQIDPTPFKTTIELR